MATTRNNNVRRTEKGLTDRQKRFVSSYLIDLNGTRAASEAGYKLPHMAAQKLLKVPGINALIIASQKETQTRHVLTKEVVLEQLFYGVTRDGSDFVDENGFIISNIRKLPKRAQAMIDGIEQDVWVDAEGNEHHKTKLKLVNKATVIDMAMKHLGAYAPDKLDVNVKQTLAWDDIAGVLSDDEVDIVEQRLIEAATPPIPQDIIETTATPVSSTRKKR